jgi:uncharacterized membrane protein
MEIFDNISSTRRCLASKNNINVVVEAMSYIVSVAGCLGYDVLEFMEITSSDSFIVSVAG